MLSEAPAWIRHALRTVLLPKVYASLDWSSITRSRLEVAFDLLYSHIALRNFPDNYGPCRLWEMPREEWAKYYGSNYNPFQRQRLRREVHPYHLEVGLRSKIVADSLCRAMGIPVPVQRAILSPSDNVESALRAAFRASGRTRLILKPEYGHAGLGIALARLEDAGISIVTGGSTVLAGQFRAPERMVVQDILEQDDRVSKLAPGSVNTLRLLTMLTRSDEYLVIGASMRFGVGGSFIDNWSAGGVAVGVDVERGALLARAFDKKGSGYFRHPQTNVVFSGHQIPDWDEAIRLGERVQRAFPFFRLLGMDIAFTTSGPVLIEINNDADLVFQEQTSGPLLASRQTWEAFRSYELLINRAQRELFASA